MRENSAAFFCNRERAPLRRPGPMRVEMNFSRLGLEKLARCLRSKAITVNLCGTRGCAPRGSCDAAPLSTAGTAERTKTLSPQITGVPEPRPGSSTFQRTFFVSLHSTGGSAVFDTPVA